MIRNFPALGSRILPEGAAYAHPMQSAPSQVTLESPAQDVMTDLTHVVAITIQPRDTIRDAERRMMQFGVGLLVVEDSEHRVTGVVTVTDVLGEKPVQIAVTQVMHRDEITVRAIMTPCAALQVLTVEQVRVAHVGNIYSTLQQSGHQHALVIERHSALDIRVRGIFSMTQICRQLNLPRQASFVAQTFAEIESSFLH